MKDRDHGSIPSNKELSVDTLEFRQGAWAHGVVARGDNSKRVGWDLGVEANP
jgi:hypothetical protein